MGHKAHPIGLRLGIHRKWKANWFFESKNYTKFLQTNFYIENFIKGFLFFLKVKKTLILRTQLIKLSSNIIFVFIFYYRFRKKKKGKKSSLKKKKETLKIWRNFLEKFFLKKKILKNQFTQITYNFKLLKFLQKNAKKSFFVANNHVLFKLNLQQIKQKKIFNIMFFKIICFFFKISFLKKHLKFLNKNYTQMLLKKNRDIYILCIKYLKIFLLFFNKQLTKEILKKKHIIILKNFQNINLIKIKYFWLSKVQNKKKIKIFFKIFLKKIFVIQKFWKKNLFLYFTLQKFFLKKKIQTVKILKKEFQVLKNLRKKIQTLKILRKKSNLIKKKFIFIINKKTKTLTILSIFLNKKNKKYFKKYNKKFKLEHPLAKIKKFLTKLTNIKYNLIFINALSFTKFFYLIQEKNIIKTQKHSSNILAIQRMMLNRYKYNAIFIKDFIFLTYITTLLKTPIPLVKFIAHQFKRLPKNRKQSKLLKFINQSLKIFCKQYQGILGFKFQITGRLNRRRRTHKWIFQKGILSLQSQESRVEYAFSEGFTRRGLIGIHFWIFYTKHFSNILKKKLIQYLYYSKYKIILNKLNTKLILNLKNKLSLKFQPKFKLKKNFYYKKK